MTTPPKERYVIKERPSPKQQAGILVLSRDERLLTALEQSIRVGHALRHTETLNQAEELVETGAFGVLVTDMAVERDDVIELTYRLGSHAPSLVFIVVGDRDHGHELVDLVNSGRIYRFLLKPISPGQTRLTVQAAMRQHLVLRRNPKPPPEPPPTRTLAAEPEPESDLSSAFTEALEHVLEGHQRKRNMILGIAAGILVLVTGLVLVFRGSGERDIGQVSDVPAVSSLQTTSEIEGPPGGVELLLDSAQRALEAGRVVAPENDSALAYFNAVLEQDPANASANEGLNRVTDILLSHAKQALEDDNFEEAVGIVQTARTIRPNHPGIEPIDALIHDHGEKWLARAEQETDSGASSSPQSRTATPTPAQTPAPAPARRAVTRDQAPAQQVQTAAAEPRTPPARQPSAPTAEPEATPRPAAPTPPPVESARERPEPPARTPLETRTAAAQGPAQAQLRPAPEPPRPSPPEEAPRQLAAEAGTGSAATAVTGANPDPVELSRLANARMNEGLLLTPEGDSAKFYVQALGRSDPSGQVVQRDRERLAALMLEQARLAMANEQLDLAERWLTEAKDLEPAQQASAAREQPLGGGSSGIARDLNVGVATSGSAAPLEDETAEPAAPAPRTRGRATEETVPVSELEFRKYVEPKYPRGAYLRGLDGWVDVAFTVAPSGQTTDIQILDADPPDKFDEAAYEAVAQWEFNPKVTDGDAGETRAKVRVRFKID